jgi:alpha-L-rhamnosidase
VGDLAWVKAHHDSPYGRIASAWKRSGNRLTLEVAIPPNTTATIYVPAKDAAAVRESGKLAANVSGLKFLRAGDDLAVFEAGSGHYRFESEPGSP